MRYLITALTVACTLTLGGAPATAQVTAPVGGIERPDSAPNSWDLWITHGAAGEGISLGTNPFDDCTFEWSLTGDQALDYAGARGQFDYDIDPAISTSDELFHFMSCPHSANPLFAVWPESDPVPPRITDALADAARSRLTIPVESPQANPPGTEDWPFITQMPVWLWNDSYGTQTATASLTELGAPIQASITVTATATQTSWNPGDGSAPIICTEGQAWTAETTSEPTCVHTYVSRTKGTPFTLSVTTTWALNVTCQPAAICADIAFDNVDTTTSREVHVRSIFPVISG